MARSTHPLQLSDGVAMVTTTAQPLTDNVSPQRTAAPRRLLTFIRSEFLATLGIVLVLVMSVTGIFAELIAPYNPTANDFAAMMEAPGWAHPLGTDQFGRDLLSRIIYGARTAMIVGLSSALVGGACGLVLGVGSAYFGGRTDLILQRIFDVLMAFPLIIMALAVVAIFGTGVANVIIAITIPLIPRCARVVRSSALAIREVPYIDAARALGFGHLRIILVHMAQRHGAVPDHGDGLRRPGHSGGSVAVLSRPRRAGAGPGLGVDAAGGRRGVCHQRSLDRNLPRPCHRAFRAGHQPHRRCLARSSRPQTSQALGQRSIPAAQGHPSQRQTICVPPLWTTAPA
jgi:ABC-type phosphate/phosphonate transport system permease subunit